MGHVDNSQIAPLFANTTPGVTADANAVDPAISALIVAINENFDSFEAFKASIELPIPDQSIVSRHLRNLAVTNPKLAPLAVTADKIADGTISTQKLADLVITAQKIANNAILERHMSNASVSRRTIQAGAVGANEIDPTILTPISDAAVQVKFNQIDEQLADMAINVKTFSNYVVNNDWTEAIRQACAQLKLWGGGKLLFPKDVYNIFTTGLYANIADLILFDFDDTSNIEFDFQGSTFVVNRTEPRSTIWTYFKFKDAKNITLHDLILDSPDASVYGGAVVLEIGSGCENISVYNITGEGADRLISADGYNGISYQEGSIKNIVANNVHLTGCYKPFTLRFGVKGVRIENYSLDIGHRAVHLYGVEDVYIEVEASNCTANAILFTSYYTLMPLGLRNATIKAKSNGQGPSATSLVVFNYVGGGVGSVGSGIFDSINVNVEVGSSIGFAEAIGFGNYINDNPITNDTAAKGHIFKDVTLSGHIKGGGKRFISFDGLFLGDNVNNLSLENITVENGATSTIYATALNDTIALNNITSPNFSFRVRNVPAGKRVTFKGCNILTACDDNSPVSFIDTVITPGTHVRTNKEYVNTSLGDSFFLNNVIPVVKTGSDISWFDVRTEVVARAEYITLGNVTSKVLTLVLPGNGNYLTSRYYQPNVFRFQIGLQNINATEIGCITGEVLLKKNNVSSTKLDVSPYILKSDKYKIAGSHVATVTATNGSNGELIFTVTCDIACIDRIGVALFV